MGLEGVSGPPSRTSPTGSISATSAGSHGRPIRVVRPVQRDARGLRVETVRFRPVRREAGQELRRQADRDSRSARAAAPAAGEDLLLEVHRVVVAGVVARVGCVGRPSRVVIERVGSLPLTLFATAVVVAHVIFGHREVGNRLPRPEDRARQPSRWLTGSGHVVLVAIGHHILIRADVDPLPRARLTDQPPVLVRLEVVVPLALCVLPDYADSHRERPGITGLSRRRSPHNQRLSRKAIRSPGGR